MKTIKTIIPLLILLAMSSAAHAYILWNENTNEPYTNGCIEGQGSWYCYSPSKPLRNTGVTNNILYLLNVSTNDEVGAPTNGATGWANLNTGEFTYVNFALNVSQIPTLNGSYFFQLQNNRDSNDCCHIFIDGRGTNVPGTFQLGIANYDTSFANLTPPNNYPEDLSTGVWYNVTVLFDTNYNNLTFQGATLFVNPSLQDYTNLANAGGEGGSGFVFGVDSTENQALLGISIGQFGFSPYLAAQVSNIVVGTTMNDVIQTNLPVFGMQPQPGTNYTGNSANFYAVASAVDPTYQWYSVNYGKLSDNTTYAHGDSVTGSATDALTVNNLGASDTYYCIVTDAYGNTATSSSALEYVITTPTPVFFSTNDVPVTNTVYEFSTATFNDPASGSGPITYQWYFAPAATPNTYSQIGGQSSVLYTQYLDSTNYSGNYYVVASSSAFGGSSAIGPTNTLIDLPALVLTNMAQLHGLVSSNQFVSSYKNTVGIFTNVLITGYVGNFIGWGSTYTEYMLVDSTGLGAEVYLQNATLNLGNDNMPPIGSCVRVIGALQMYDGTFQITPSDLSAVTVISNAPPLTIAPIVANNLFGTFVTNGSAAIAQYYDCSLVTFTNVWITGSKGALPPGSGGVFYSNSYTTAYFTLNSPYNPTNPATGLGKNPAFPANTNNLEIYQYGYDHPHTGLNPFDYQKIPTNCFQLTGFYVDYNGVGELEPTRPADYVTNAPAPFPASIQETNGTAKVTWSPQVGSTYSINSSTSVGGPYPQVATGLAYYPTNGSYTDTNTAPAKFYNITSP
jgi:hypothetical protein